MKFAIPTDSFTVYHLPLSDYYAISSGFTDDKRIMVYVWKMVNGKRKMTFFGGNLS